MHPTDGRDVTRAREESRGQVIVIMALALVALLSVVGLVIDGGNAFARQRATQNATDASAEAGAGQLLRRLARVPAPAAGWNAEVLAAVQANATQNGITGPLVIEYTDLQGNILGAVPGSGDPAANVAGVKVTASQTFDTFVSRVIGINQLTATTDATAVAGYGIASGRGGVLPITFPLVLTVCDGSSDAQYFDQEWPHNVTIAIPLCKNTAGNVGWIDWYPPAGGADELADAIQSPSNPTVTTPKWYFIAATGNVNSGQVQSALDTWVGDDILLPIFYADVNAPIPGACDATPDGDMTQLADCPVANRGGNGQNQWYYLVTFASFHLDAAYAQGNHTTECNAPGLITVAGGNGGTSCLVGHFNAAVAAASMTVGSAGTYTSEYTPLTIQLID